MRRWETWLALLAVTLANLSAVRIGGHSRPLLAFAAIALLLVVGLSRLRAAAQSKRERPVVDAYERALRIQEARERKYH